MKINTKVILSITSLVALFYLAALIYISYVSRERALRDAQNLAKKEAEAFANHVKSELNTDMGVVRSLAEGFSAYNGIASKTLREKQADMMRNIYKSSSDYLALWVSWELYAIDSSYQKSHGRQTLEFFTNNTTIESRYSNRDMDSPNEGSMYYSIKMNPQEIITEPYYYTYTDDSVLEASISAPMMHYNLFVGIVGVDVSLQRFYGLIRDIKPFKNSFAFLVSNGGIIIAHPQKEFMGKNLKDIYPKMVIDNNIESRINLGLSTSIVDNIKGREGKQYITLSPFKVGKSSIPWAVGLVVPEKVILEEGTNAFKISLIIGIVGLILLIIVIALIMSRLTKPVEQSTRVLEKIKDGVINENLKIKISRKDEFGAIAKAVNEVIGELSDVVNSAREIGKGNLNIDYRLRSENDMLGHAILEMQKNLSLLKEEEAERKKEQEIRTWISVGLAKIGTLILQDYEKIDEMANSAISNLVKYLDAASGGFFILNKPTDEEPYLEMIANFAYERSRSERKKISIQEGFVGTVYQSKKILKIDNVPASYLQIKSGLGSAPPRYLVLVPILQQKTLLGIIEVSSFSEFKDYEFEFLENITQSIANAISSFIHQKQNEKFIVQQEVQTELMKINEQKALDALKKLQKQQVTSLRREAELNSLLEAIKQSVFVVIYNTEGKIIDINEKFAHFLDVPRKKLLGTMQGDFLVLKDSNENSKDIWKKVVKDKKTIDVIQKIKISQKKFNLASTFSPIVNEENKVEMVINIAFKLEID